jgi:tetratricopeptide (TPR) repeat protein
MLKSRTLLLLNPRARDHSTSMPNHKPPTTNHSLSPLFCCTCTMMEMIEETGPEKQPLTASDLKELGNKAFATQQYEEAIDFYSKAITLDAKNHILYSNRSACRAGLKDWVKAAEDGMECIRLDPSFLKGYYRLATAQIEQKDYDKALSTIRQGLTVDPNNSQLTKQMRTIKQLQKAAAAKLKQQQIGGNNARLDDAASKELQELQAQHQHSTRELGTAQVNLNMIKREHRITELCQTELEPLESSHTCYRSLGKAFLKLDKERVVEHLDRQMQEGKKKETDLTQKMEYLERQIKSQVQNIEEIVKPTAAATE